MALRFGNWGRGGCAPRAAEARAVGAGARAAESSALQASLLTYGRRSCSQYARRVAGGDIDGGDEEQARTVQALQALWGRMEVRRGGRGGGWTRQQAQRDCRVVCCVRFLTRCALGGAQGCTPGWGSAGASAEAPALAAAAPAPAPEQRQERSQASMWTQLWGGSSDSAGHSGGWGAAAAGGGLFGAENAAKGLYLWSRSPGTGKTMLMDMFFDLVPLPATSKRRVHFHDFMLDVHRRTHRAGSVADPLACVADELSSEAALLCLDELMVTDVADAMIIGRLFEALWARGMVVVGTSNRHPTELYENGLQRELFLPFIDALQERCVIHEIASGTDYRHRANLSKASTYFVGEDAAAQLERRVTLTAGGGPPEELQADEVPVQMGRTLEVPRAAKLNRAALFDYEELCWQPVGAADFLGLLEAYPTVAISGVPVFDAANKHTAYRFVTLVDVAYDQRAKLLVGAAGQPAELFGNVVTVKEAREIAASGQMPNPFQVVDDNLGFSKERTISRLTEMQSEEYLLTTRALSPDHLKQVEDARRRDPQTNKIKGRKAEELYA